MLSNQALKRIAQILSTGEDSLTLTIRGESIHKGWKDIPERLVGNFSTFYEINSIIQEDNYKDFMKYRVEPYVSEYLMDSLGAAAFDPHIKITTEFSNELFDTDFSPESPRIKHSIVYYLSDDSSVDDTYTPIVEIYLEVSAS